MCCSMMRREENIEKVKRNVQTVCATLSRCKKAWKQADVGGVMQTLRKAIGECFKILF